MIENNNKTEKKIIEAVENIQTPQRLAPENMMSEIEKRKDRKNRSMIKQIISMSSMVAVVAVIVGLGAVCYNNNLKALETQDENTSSAGKSSSEPDSSSQIKTTEITDRGYKSQEIENLSYKDVYNKFKVSESNYKKQQGYYLQDFGDNGFDDGVFADGADMAENFKAEQSNETNSSVSQTYSQAEDIEEMDTVKACKQGVFYVNGNKIEIVKTDDTSLDEINISDYLNGDFRYIKGILLNENTLTVLVNQTNEYSYKLEDSSKDRVGVNARTAVVSFDVSDINNISLLNNYTVDGELKDAHITDGKLYLCTAYSPYFNENIICDEEKPYYVPSYTTDGEDCVLSQEKIFCPKEEDALYYNVVSAIDLKSGEMLDVCTVFGNFGCLYMNDAIYIANTSYDYNRSKDITSITKIEYDQNGKLNPSGACSLDGYVNDKYSLEQDKDGNFYVALTDRDLHTGQNVNYLVKLDENLQQLGFSKYFGENETIKSASFDDQKAYVVTYRQTDPLFTIDLNSLEILSETKVTGFSTTLRKMGDYLVGFGEENTQANFVDGIKLSVFGEQDYKLVDSVSWVNQDDYRDYNYGDDYEYLGHEYYSSSAEHDSKAIMIDEDKNIIAFGVWADLFKNGEFKTQNLIEVYSLDGKLNQLCEIDANEYLDNNNTVGIDRFAYVDNSLYAFDVAGCVRVDMDSWQVQGTVAFDVDTSNFEIIE